MARARSSEQAERKAAPAASSGETGNHTALIRVLGDINAIKKWNPRLAGVGKEYGFILRAANDGFLKERTYHNVYRLVSDSIIALREPFALEYQIMLSSDYPRDLLTHFNALQREKLQIQEVTASGPLGYKLIVNSKEQAQEFISFMDKLKSFVTNPSEQTAAVYFRYLRVLLKLKEAEQTRGQEQKAAPAFAAASTGAGERSTQEIIAAAVTELHQGVLSYEITKGTLHHDITHRSFVPIKLQLAELRVKRSQGKIKKIQFKEGVERTINQYGEQDANWGATPLVLLAMTLEEDELCNVLERIGVAHGLGYDGVKSAHEILNKQDKEGRTVLHYAYALGLEKAAAKLESLRADVGIKDRNEQTAKELADKIDQKSIDEILSKVAIYPNRDKSATKNALDPIKANDGNVYHLPHSKEMLEAVRKARDFTTFFNKAGQEKTLTALSKCTGISIGEECLWRTMVMRERSTQAAFDAAADAMHKKWVAEQKSQFDGEHAARQSARGGRSRGAK